MVRRGIEILRGAAVSLNSAQIGVARIHRRTAQPHQLSQQPLHLLGRRGFHPQPQPRRLGVGPADEEVLHVEVAVELDHRVEDLLHDVGIDKVPFRLHHFVDRRGPARLSHEY